MKKQYSWLEILFGRFKWVRARAKGHVWIKINEPGFSWVKFTKQEVQDFEQTGHDLLGPATLNKEVEDYR
jgi:hypothetical protein